jgi:hypothetical protein
VSLPPILHKDCRRAGDVRPGLTRAALIHVVVGNLAPGVVVIGIDGTQRGNPSAGRGHVGLDAPIFARAATGKIRHRIRAIAVDEEVGATVLRGSGGDDIFGDSRTANGLFAGTGVAGGEFEYVWLITGRKRIADGIANQCVKFHRAKIVTALRVVAPTVRANVRAGKFRVAREPLETGIGISVAAGSIEEPLPNEARTGRDTETKKIAIVVHLAGGAVARDDAGAMRAMTVFIGTVFQCAVMKQRRDATGDVRVHEVCIPTIEAAVGDGHSDACAGVSELMHGGQRAGIVVVARDNLGGNFVLQLHAGRGFNP